VWWWWWVGVCEGEWDVGGPCLGHTQCYPSAPPPPLYCSLLCGCAPRSHLCCCRTLLPLPPVPPAATGPRLPPPCAPLQTHPCSRPPACPCPRTGCPSSFHIANFCTPHPPPAGPPASGRIGIAGGNPAVPFLAAGACVQLLLNSNLRRFTPPHHHPSPADGGRRVAPPPRHPAPVAVAGGVCVCGGGGAGLGGARCCGTQACGESVFSIELLIRSSCSNLM
jgi:hypothetical protein